MEGAGEAAADSLQAPTRVSRLTGLGAIHRTGGVTAMGEYKA